MASSSESHGTHDLNFPVESSDYGEFTPITVGTGTPTALPREAEVVAHAEFLGGRPTAVRLDKSRHCTIPLVTLASLQAMQARAEAAERERDAFRDMADGYGKLDAELAIAEARVKELEEALNHIDALDPEEHLFGVSHDACRGLIARMGEAARSTLKGGSNG